MNDEVPEDLGGLRQDERQAKLNQDKDRNRKPIKPPAKADLSKLHGLSLGGRNRINLHLRNGKGDTLNANNLSGEEMLSTYRMWLRANGGDPGPSARDPKPGEPEQVMTRAAMADALRSAGLTGLLVEEMVSLATQEVITRDHVQYETYQGRFQNRLRATAKILWDEDQLVVWGKTERVDGINKKRFWSGPTAPAGVDIVEPGP